MRKTKSEGKTVGIFANCSHNAKISQCENSQCENFAMRNFTANFAMRNFAMRNFTANFAMRKTTLRISQCEKPQRISQCEISQCEKPFCEIRNAKNHFAKFAMRKTTFRNAKWLPTDCQNSCFAFFFKICSKISKKTTKLMQDKLHKSKN